FDFFGFAGSFACAVLGGLGRQLFPGLCPAAPDQTLSLCFSAGSGGPGVSLQRDFEPANRYRRDPGGSADCAVYRAGRGSDAAAATLELGEVSVQEDRKSTRLNSSHVAISYAVFCLKKKK